MKGFDMCVCLYKGVGQERWRKWLYETEEKGNTKGWENGFCL